MHFVDAKGILSTKNGINVYRGCTHGCVYCDSRSVCYGFTHNFEDIEVKRNAPELLDDALRRRCAKCMIGTGSMCDPYQPCERELCLTRRCLEVILRRGFGLSVLTKSDLILRDLDLLCAINERARCVAQLTLTTFDEKLCRALEPAVCATRRRYETLKILHEHKIPTVVWITPILPFINDTEANLRGLLDYCFDAGVAGILTFGFGVTLRDGDRDYFYASLDRKPLCDEFPNIKRRYSEAFGGAYECRSPNAAALEKIFNAECDARGVLRGTDKIFAFLNEFPSSDTAEQLSLF